MTQNEIEAAIKSIPKRKSPGPDRFSAEFHETFKEELTPTLLKFVHKIEREGILPHSVKPVLHSSQNQAKTHPKRRTIEPISLMNINAKILNSKPNATGYHKDHSP
jgi:hypothetical protein